MTHLKILNTVSVTSTSKLELCRGITAVCSQIHTKQRSELSRYNVQCFNVTTGGTHNNHWAVIGLSVVTVTFTALSIIRIHFDMK